MTSQRPTYPIPVLLVALLAAGLPAAPTQATTDSAAPMQGTTESAAQMQAANMEAVREEADAALAASDWETASRAYRRLVEADPDDVASWFRLAHSLHLSGDLPGAVAAYESLLESDNATPFAQQTNLRIARALAAQGLTDEAVARMKEFAAGGPNRSALSLLESATELESLRHTETYAEVVELLTPCLTPEYRQFDFWIGDWEVYGPGGQLAGTNLIQPVLEGCSIRENWTNSANSQGHSYNFYDRTADKWHQTWIDDSGNPLYLDGGLDEHGNMVLADETNRITYTLLDNGYVRQHWEVTNDGGKTWTTSFDGEYRPAAQ